MVATPWDAGGPELVGREADLAQLTDVISGVCAGTARTFIVAGDAGVGKSALVSRACASAPEALMLMGGALPLASVDVPFLALRSAFRAAASTARHCCRLTCPAMRVRICWSRSMSGSRGKAV